MSRMPIDQERHAASAPTNPEGNPATPYMELGQGNLCAHLRPESGVLNCEAETELFYGSIDISQIGAPMAVCSRDGLLLGLTPSGKNLLERASQPTDTLPVPLITGLWNGCRHLESGQNFHFQAHCNESLTLSCTVHPLGETQLLLIFEEISSKQQALSSRLHQQRLELTGRLVAMIAHDLRVPLATIVFNAEMARTDHPTREVSVALRDICTSADRMRASIDGLLDFARPGGSRCSTVDLNTTFGRLRSLLHPSLREGRHELCCDLDPHATLVHTNPLLLEHVLVNLVMNAVEASEKPTEIRIFAAMDAARHATNSGLDSRQTNLVRISVHDNGPGIPPAIADRIFEPFFTTKKSGTGLGLPMAREAMAAIGATLSLEPCARGACFSLTLPTPKLRATV